MANPLLAPFMRWLGRLGFPKLFLLFAGLFVLDAVTLDPIPFIARPIAFRQAIQAATDALPGATLGRRTCESPQDPALRHPDRV